MKESWRTEGGQSGVLCSVVGADANAVVAVDYADGN